MSKKKILVCGLASLLVVGGVATIGGAKSLHVSGADCAHSHVEHYKVRPTTTDGGRAEHWACCDCGQAWYDEAKTRVVENRADLDIAASTVATQIGVDSLAIDDITCIYTASDKTKGLDQGVYADPVTSVKVAGEYSYYRVDDRQAIRISAMDLDETKKSLRDSQSSGFSECRFAKETTTTSITFDYKYWDVNREVSTAEGGSLHNAVQWYDGSKYNTVAADLIPDNQWHTITLNQTEDKAALKYLVMKFYHMEGEIYISNLRIGEAATPVYTSYLYGAKITPVTTVENSGSVVVMSDPYTNEGVTYGLKYTADHQALNGVNTMDAYYTLEMPRVDLRSYSAITYPFLVWNRMGIGLSQEKMIELPDSGTFVGFLYLQKVSNTSYRAILKVNGSTVTDVIEDADVVKGVKGAQLSMHEEYIWGRRFYVGNITTATPDFSATLTASNLSSKSFANGQYLGMTCVGGRNDNYFEYTSAADGVKFAGGLKVHSESAEKYTPVYTTLPTTDYKSFANGVRYEIAFNSGDTSIGVGEEFYTFSASGNPNAFGAMEIVYNRTTEKLNVTFKSTCAEYTAAPVTIEVADDTIALGLNPLKITTKAQVYRNLHISYPVAL